MHSAKFHAIYVDTQRDLVDRDDVNNIKNTNNNSWFMKKITVWTKSTICFIFKCHSLFEWMSEAVTADTNEWNTYFILNIRIDTVAVSCDLRDYRLRFVTLARMQPLN